jgi:hypothetical protein
MECTFCIGTGIEKRDEKYIDIYLAAMDSGVNRKCIATRDIIFVGSKKQQKRFFKNFI